jgi:prevent-host-death family protein
MTKARRDSAARDPAKPSTAPRAGQTRVSSVSSTEAQNALGDILARVGRGERIFITRYGRRQAVLLSPEAYHGLAGEESVDLSELEREFEEMLERMQSGEHASASDAFFEMTGPDVGKAAAPSEPPNR